MADAELSSHPNIYERLLVIFMRLVAIATFFALVAVFMPMSCMAWVHKRLELGEMPQGPIVEYLARSTSAFYALHGGFLWLVSTDLKRYGPVLTYMIWTLIVCGVGLLALDLHAGMPTHWTMMEGPWVIMLGVVMLVLRRKGRV
ncbi:MAG TPA: hypothetical protein VGP72_15015 [Planctomycetota bacterium]|jgi:hypothetical protein